MEDEDFLAAIEADNTDVPVEDAEPTPAKAEEPQAPPEPEQPAPAENALVEPVTPTEPPVPTEAAQPQHVPLTAMLDERDKRKALEAELAQYRAQQQQAQPVQSPDPYEDPEGFAQAQEQRVQQAIYQQNLRWSEQLASMKHGEETVTAAKEWGVNRCDTDPYFNAKVAASPDPIGYVVSEYKREQIASQVTPDEFTQFQAWKAAQAQIQQQAPSGVTPQSSPAIPPRSLASAPSAGGVMAEPEQTDADIFAETFKKD